MPNHLMIINSALSSTVHEGTHNLVISAANFSTVFEVNSTRHNACRMRLTKMLYYGMHTPFTTLNLTHVITSHL